MWWSMPSHLYHMLKWRATPPLLVAGGHWTAPQQLATHFAVQPLQTVANTNHSIPQGTMQPLSVKESRKHQKALRYSDNKHQIVQYHYLPNKNAINKWLNICKGIWVNQITMVVILLTIMWHTSAADKLICMALLCCSSVLALCSAASTAIVKQQRNQNQVLSTYNTACQHIKHKS